MWYLTYVCSMNLSRKFFLYDVRHCGCMHTTRGSHLCDIVHCVYYTHMGRFNRTEWDTNQTVFCAALLSIKIMDSNGEAQSKRVKRSSRLKWTASIPIEFEFNWMRNMKLDCRWIKWGWNSPKNNRWNPPSYCFVFKPSSSVVFLFSLLFFPTTVN